MKSKFTLAVAAALLTTSINAQVAENWVKTDIDGQSHELYDVLNQGKVLMIDFFYYSCAPCNSSMPYVEDMYDLMGPNGEDIMELWSMDVNNELHLVQAWRTKYHVTNPLFNNMNAEYWSITGGGGIPTFTTICPDGTHSSFIGGIHSVDQFETMVRACGVISGEDKVIEKKFTFYPNPGTDIVNVIHPTLQDFEINILDLTGRVIRTEKLIAGKLDISDLSAGSYFVQLADLGETKMLIKE